MRLRGTWLLLLGAVAAGCTDEPKPVAVDETATMVAAWKEAGAEFGWMGPNQSGLMAWQAQLSPGAVGLGFITPQDAAEVKVEISRQAGSQSRAG